MDTVLVILQAVVVIGAIVLGVRMGGIGLGLWGVAGTAVLVFGFRLAPGNPPVDAFFIIIAVVTASAAMQAVGGIDYLVSLASRIIRRNPKRLTYVAPLVAFVFTVISGTSNIYFALIPVIYETAYRNGQRPERALASSTVTSGLGITASPVSAAMAAYLTLVPDFSLPKILLITTPSAIVACLVTSFVQQRLGKELVDDPGFARRVASGELAVPAVIARDPQAVARLRATAAALPDLPKRSPQERAAAESAVKVDDGAQAEETISPLGKRSAVVFLLGVALIVLFGLFPSLRPSFPADDGTSAPLGMTSVIELIMFTVALVIMLVAKGKPADVLDASLLKSGLVAAIALFGIAWMADTFISANQKTIVEPIGSIIHSHPLFLGVALFLVCALTTSQSTATRTVIPIALAAGMPAPLITAMWPSLIGVWLFPANGSQIAAVATDLTGTTRLSSVPVWHSFTIPMLVSWVSVVGVGLLIQLAL